MIDTVFVRREDNSRYFKLAKLHRQLTENSAAELETGCVNKIVTRQNFVNFCDHFPNTFDREVECVALHLFTHKHEQYYSV